MHESRRKLFLLRASMKKPIRLLLTLNAIITIKKYIYIHIILTSCIVVVLRFPSQYLCRTYNIIRWWRRQRLQCVYNILILLSPCGCAPRWFTRKRDRVVVVVVVSKIKYIDNDRVSGGEVVVAVVWTRANECPEMQTRFRNLRWWWLCSVQSHTPQCSALEKKITFLIGFRTRRLWISFEQTKK